MKRLFEIVLTGLAAVSAVVSCQKEGTAHADADLVSVKLVVAAPGDAQTKSISDGRTVNWVYWAAFDENNEPVERLSGKKALSDKTASFDVQLVKDYPYNFVFWAQYENENEYESAYDLTSFTSQGVVTVKYEGVANDECRDAFYKQQIIKVTSAGETCNVYLTRPFAQINFLAADYKAVEEVGVDKSLKSTVTISGLPTVLNGLTGKVSGSGNTTLEASAVPAEKYTIDNTAYGWYSMNYVLADDESKIQTMSATFTHDKSSNPVVVEAKNVPYKRNHRTNIIGNFLTEMAVVNVVVLEKFDDYDYNIDENGNPLK